MSTIPVRLQPDHRWIDHRGGAVMKAMLGLLLVVGIVVVPVMIPAQTITQPQVVPEQSKPTIVSNNTCNPTCICNCYPPKLYAEPITQTREQVRKDGHKEVLDTKVTADREKNPGNLPPQVDQQLQESPVNRAPQVDQQQVVPEQSKSTIVSNNTCNPTCICNCYPPK